MRNVLAGRVFDVGVIGGGLTGTAVARDAAGRGLSVFLCDQGDLAGGSSSATTRVIHGSLQLMENFRLRAMREAVAEREILLHAAPHLVRPRRFLIPHHERQWSPWLMRAGLAAFDRVARSSLPSSELVDLHGHDGPLQPHFRAAFVYYDCVADDSRLAIANAIDAQIRGATVEPRMRCVVAERDGGRWRLSLECASTGERSTVLARILVNAGGAAAGEVLNHVVHAHGRFGVRMRKAAHVIVRWPHSDATSYALPTEHGGVVYAVPCEGGTMLVGPLLSEYSGEATKPSVGRSEVAGLLDILGQYFQAAPVADDVLWAFACVTTVPDNDGYGTDPGYSVVVDAPANIAPVLSAFGGSLLTHRRLAELVVDRMGRVRQIAPAWTFGASLPGGAFPPGDFGGIVRALAAAYPFLAEETVSRLVAAYGTRASAILTGKRSTADLGGLYGIDLTEAEVSYLMQEEWAESAEDVLWRRSKLGLRFTAEEAADLDRAMARREAAAAVA
ncbi:MAG TPA: glycerol-3-phosphate dehydrogenase [Bauldia sp.]|nr:glycerol-3-phosphate dehydrogenase [Bauldia sp.]